MRHSLSLTNLLPILGKSPRGVRRLVLLGLLAMSAPAFAAEVDKSGQPQTEQQAQQFLASCQQGRISQLKYPSLAKKLEADIREVCGLELAYRQCLNENGKWVKADLEKATDPIALITKSTKSNCGRIEEEKRPLEIDLAQYQKPREPAKITEGLNTMKGPVDLEGKSKPNARPPAPGSLIVAGQDPVNP